MIWEFIILGVILLISIFLEKVFFEINSYLWIVGGIIALVFGVLEIGPISWLEAVICFVVSYFVIIFIRAFIVDILRFMGGGLLKGLMMCALFLGRYVLITYLLFFLLLFIMEKIREYRKKDEIPGDTLVRGMPLLTASVAVTVLAVYIFFVR